MFGCLFDVALLDDRSRLGLSVPCSNPGVRSWRGGAGRCYLEARVSGGSVFFLVGGGAGDLVIALGLAGSHVFGFDGGEWHVTCRSISVIFLIRVLEFDSKSVGDGGMVGL